MMKKNHLRKKERYFVVLDSNIVRQGFPINNKVLKLIENFRRDARVEVKVYLPEVVKDEFIYYFKVSFRDKEARYVDSVKDIEKVTDLGFTKLIFSDEKLVGIAEDILNGNGIQIIPTPLDKINFGSLLKKAAFHEVPFEKNEKGFKDSVVAETFVDFFISNKKSNTHVALICNDGVLKDSVLNRQDLGLVRVYSTIESFESELNLNLEDIDAEEAHQLVEAATAAFITYKDPGCVYEKSNLQQLIDRAINAAISRYKVERDYTEIENFTDTFATKTLSSGFIRKEGEFFVWANDVVVTLTSKTESHTGVFIFDATSQFKFRAEWRGKWNGKAFDENELLKFDLVSQRIDPLYFTRSRNTDVDGSYMDRGTTVFYQVKQGSWNNSLVNKGKRATLHLGKDVDTYLSNPSGSWNLFSSDSSKAKEVEGGATDAK